MRESSIQERKHKALGFFLKELLGNEARNSIAKIILFGSLSKGQAGEKSDIDLLVVASGSMKEVSNACADASFETALATGESVEPLVRCVDEVRYPRSYFLYHTSRSGKVIYSRSRKKKPEKSLTDLAESFLETLEKKLAES